MVLNKMAPKHPSKISLDFKEALKWRGPEKLAAVRTCWADLIVYEKALAADPSFGSYHEVQHLRELTRLIEASLNRLEAGDKRRRAREDENG